MLITVWPRPHPIPVHTNRSSKVLSTDATPVVKAKDKRTMLPPQRPGSSPLVGGHRGMGMNLLQDGQLQPRQRENTLRSFLEAVDHGVTFIEFDVQVTRDGHPVIWHDDDVIFDELEDSSAAGMPSSPPVSRSVAELTLAQLRALVVQAPEVPAEVALSESLAALQFSSPFQQVQADHGNQQTPGNATGVKTWHSRLYRRFYNLNTAQTEVGLRRWTLVEEDFLPTLAEVFAALPPHVAFDLEVKLANGPEVVHTPQEEIDRMLLPIIEEVARHSNSNSGNGSSKSVPLLMADRAGSSDSTGTCTSFGGYSSCSESSSSSSSSMQGGISGGGRWVTYSSFDPDVCAQLVKRQQLHPVAYLSGCGLYKHADERRTSVKTAVEWAHDSGCAGLVVPVSVVLAKPEMVMQVHAAGLHIATYGLGNSLKEAVDAQTELGVDGIIVDGV